MCNPCQEGDDHAQGHPVGSSHPRREGINFVYIVLEGLYFSSICKPRPLMQISSILSLRSLCFSQQYPCSRPLKKAQ